jgi:lipopolysaccharide/colanic/teichoic acid biosynthesis glycosyltransferase
MAMSDHQAVLETSAGAVAGEAIGAGDEREFPYFNHAEAAAYPHADRHKVTLGLRLFEIAVAGSVLLVSGPLLVAIGLYLRMGTPGPAIFRQQRMGKGAKNFPFIKFRTLYADARQRFPELYAYQYSPDEIQTMKFKIDPDPRVTPQGVWLRKSTLDELPNFWNVLRGDMALVGPRPEIPEMLQYYEGWMLEKYKVRPGITGLAQVSGRGNLSFMDTVKYDVEYVRTRSFWGDIKILFKTLVRCVQRDGAF